MLWTWGSGYIGNWIGVTVRNNALAELVITPPSSNEGSRSPDGVAGEIPTDLCQLGRLESVSFSRNRLSGTIPDCFALNINLLFFDAARNNLSGNIPARFGASGLSLRVFNVWQNELNGNLPGGFPNSIWLDVSGNFLSGSLPENINRSGKMLYFDASDNELSKNIPNTYSSRFTRILYFDLSNNGLDGVFDPGWINQISFVNLRIDPTFDVSNNKLCFNPAADVQPRPLLEPEDGEVLDDLDGLNWGGLWHKTVDNRRASERTRHEEIEISFVGNVCGQANFSSYSQMALPPVANVRKSINGDILTVQWDPPTDPQTGRVYAASEYELRISEAKRPNFNSDGMLKVVDNSPYRNFNAGYYADVPGATAEFNLRGGEKPLLREGQTITLDELVVGVTPRYKVAEPQGDVDTVFTGEAGGWQYQSWRSFNVVRDGVLAQEVARNLGLFLNEEMYSWDAGTQVWSTHPVEGDPTTTLDMGTAVMFKDGVTAADNLRFAGVGRADENMVVTLQQGWNIMAPARANMEVGADNPEALFDANLTDCDNLAGVLAIITYDSRIGDFKILLPCHPDVQTAGYDPLDVVDVYDTMYVFFQSQLSVPVTWDPDSGDNGNYVPA